MDREIIVLFDRFTHGGMSRRAFLDRLAALAGGSAAAAALLPLLENDYARAQTIAEGDPRIAGETMPFTAGGTALTGYLAKPKAPGRHPGVVVVHENRGLNPHIRDVARRFAIEGFVALAPDLLSPMGGTPADADKAREMLGTLLMPDDALSWLRGAVNALRTLPEVGGKLGAVGFCWGGGQVNALAVAEPMLNAAVAYYGRQPKPEQVASIHAALLLHYAGRDEPINAGIAAYEAALRAANKNYELHIYPGVEHAFNNDTNAARYNKEAADLAWSRTLAFLRRTLAG